VAFAGFHGQVKETKSLGGKQEKNKAGTAQPRVLRNRYGKSNLEEEAKKVAAECSRAGMGGGRD